MRNQVGGPTPPKPHGFPSRRDANYRERYRLLGTLLKKMRNHLGYTQQVVAAALRYSPSDISKIENGARTLEVFAVVDMLAFYGLPISVLYEETRNQVTADLNEKAHKTADIALKEMRKAAYLKGRWHGELDAEKKVKIENQQRPNQAADVQVQPDKELPWSKRRTLTVEAQKEEKPE